MKRQRYNEFRLLFTRSSLKAKKESWRSFFESSSDDNPYGFVYKMARNKINVKSAMATVYKDGQHTKDWSGTARAIMDALFGETNDDSPDRDRITSDIVPWNEGDVLKVIGMMRNGKSPGCDQIEVEMVKKAAAAGLQPVVVKLYNGCARFGVFPKIWKTGIIRIILKSPSKDPSTVRSYRPVCLLTIYSKVLERLISKAIRPVIMHPNYASMRQYGFRAGRGTEDAISCMRKAVEVSEKKMSLAILFDITGAFDNLKWQSILSELESRGTEEYLLGLISDYLFEREVRIEENYEKVTKKVI